MMAAIGRGCGYEPVAAGLRMFRRSGIRFADKDMRQQENLRRFPVILDHAVIQYDRETL
jgi:hypothetical protein